MERRLDTRKRSQNSCEFDQKQAKLIFMVSSFHL